MARMTSKGNCYLCGKQFSKTAFARHVLSAHPYAGSGEDCVVLKVEGAYGKLYWLYLDMPDATTLKTLDTFLRKIWLECCGHLSSFYIPGCGDIEMDQTVKTFPVGSTLMYEYDFGSTTELKITVAGYSKRPKQKEAIRILGRNQKYPFACQNCGKVATWFCFEYLGEEPDPFWCDDCASEYGLDEDLLLPVVNSPRMGVCGYCGEQDEFEFDPTKIV